MPPPEPFGYLSDEDRRQAIELARHIAKMNWVLFVGSGVSRSSGLPLWGELTGKMLQRLGSDVETQDPLEVASLFEANMGRTALVASLQESLATLGIEPNTLHDHLIDLCPPVIVTTNFDDLLERALDRRRLPHAPIINNQALSLTAGRLQLLKIHGDLKQPDSLVISGQDYERYPQQKQELINNELRSLAAKHSFLFVGYSVSDTDLKPQLRRVLDAQGDLARHHYLVVDTISASLTQFERRRVRLF
jgi:NAD-dependent SIR2 family protein deacetylase